MSQQFATIPIHRSSFRIIVLLIVGMVEGGSVPVFVLGDEAREIRTAEGITEYELANGLRILLGPDRSRSTFTVNITYLVGSRHEGVGEKGMAHLLEHMLFRRRSLYRRFEEKWTTGRSMRRSWYYGPCCQFPSTVESLYS